MTSTYPGNHSQTWNKCSMQNISPLSIICYVLQDNWNSWEFSRRSINGINPSPGESWLGVGLELQWTHQAQCSPKPGLLGLTIPMASYCPQA